MLEIIWIIALALACVTGAALYAKWHGAAFIPVSFIIYCTLQVGSVFFLIPRHWYKDGGNGTLSDFVLWGLLSVVISLALWVVTWLFRCLFGYVRS